MCSCIRWRGQWEQRLHCDPVLRRKKKKAEQEKKRSGDELFSLTTATAISEHEILKLSYHDRTQAK